MAISKKIKAKWVKALRSGKYKQGTGKLGNSREGYCCLGVLANIVDPNRKLHNSDDGTFGCASSAYRESRIESKKELTDIKKKVKALLGGWIPVNQKDTLVEMNDEGVDGAEMGQPLFRHIADYIEKTKSI